MDPAKCLERRFGARILLGRLIWLERFRLAGKVEPVLDRPEGGRLRPPVFDRKADEVRWRLAVLPVHGEQHHAFAAMDFEREGSRSDAPRDEGWVSHAE